MSLHADELRKIRARLGCSQSVLAASLGYSVYTVRAWEQEINRIPSTVSMWVQDAQDALNEAESIGMKEVELYIERTIQKFSLHQCIILFGPSTLLIQVINHLKGQIILNEVSERVAKGAAEKANRKREVAHVEG